MDLILLEPGDKNVFGGEKNGWASGGSLIDYDPKKDTLVATKAAETFIGEV